MEHLNEEEKGVIINQLQNENFKDYRRRLIVLAALICVATLCVLTVLTWWHTSLISRGETSIEGRINSSLRLLFLAEGKIYKNPYDFGWQENWELFLGLKSR